MEGSGVQIQQE